MSEDSLIDQQSDGGVAGYFGKMPVRGDFLSRGLPREFVEPWDDWLQLALEHSHNQFADGWLEDQASWGRPVDFETMPDGSLLVSDDQANVIYRITYSE